MNAPQIIMICVMALGVGVKLANHGQPLKGTHNVFNQLLSVGILFTILYYGGFWQCR